MSNTGKFRQFIVDQDMTMKAIFTAAIAIVAGLAVTPAGAGERLGDGATGAVVIGAVAGEAGYAAGRHIAPDVNPRSNRRLYDDRYDDGASDRHRNAAR
jgi:hypothetical protein